MEIYKGRIQKNERNVSSAYFCRSSSFGMWSVPSILFIFSLGHRIGNYGLCRSNGSCSSFSYQPFISAFSGAGRKKSFSDFSWNSQKKEKRSSWKIHCPSPLYLLFFPSCSGDFRGRIYLSSGKRGNDAWTLCETYFCTVASLCCFVRNSSFS